MDIPLSIGFLINQNTEVIENYRAQDPSCNSYPNKAFKFDYFLKASPILVVLYYPFIKLLGVSNQTVALHGLFFSFLALIGTAFIAWKLYDKWAALLSVCFTAFSLTWIIHTFNNPLHSMPATCLMMGLIISFIYYTEAYYHGKNCTKHLILIGIALSMTMLTGWIVFAFACLFLLLNVRILLGNMRWIAGSFIACTLLFILGYSIFIHSPPWSIISTIWDGYTYRFLQGQNPAIQVEWYMKPIYAVKWLFIDMKCFDHPDKYLEGSQAIPLIFTVCLGLGFFLKPNKIITTWILSSWVILCTIYLFANRYAITFIPALAIVAAIGCKDLYKYKYVSMVITPVMVATLALSYLNFSRFIHHRAANYECDRMRGHTDVYQWLKDKYNSKDTIVVLGDPISSSPLPLIFHTFYNPYKFIVAKNYSSLNDEMFIGYKNVVLVCWHTTTGVPINTDFKYTYDKRTLIHAYQLK